MRKLTNDDGKSIAYFQDSANLEDIANWVKDRLLWDGVEESNSTFGLTESWDCSVDTIPGDNYGRYDTIRISGDNDSKRYTVKNIVVELL